MAKAQCPDYVSISPPWRDEWTRAHNGITPEWHNEIVEANELARWETRPDSIFCYPELRYDPIDGYTRDVFPGMNVTTVQGYVIGTITALMPMREIAHKNCPGWPERRQAVRVRGTNGAMYWGWMWPDFPNCRLYRLKERNLR